ncbi:MAG: hypothetical protein Alis3KO_03140 [Aliiglaciecola sp.]
MNSVNTFEISAKTQISELGLNSLDIAFGQFVFQQNKPQNICVALFASLLSQRSRHQDSCLDLNDLPEATLALLGTTSVSALQQILTQASCVATRPKEQMSQPIVLEHNQGYLRRYYDYEVALSAVIQRRLSKKIDLDIGYLKHLLDQLFPAASSVNKHVEESIDWQKVAVCVAASQSFSVITGGPGTGKTTTVAKLLAVLQGLQPKDARPLTIKLVAPTGKAAARLSESLIGAKKILPESFQSTLDAQSSTIHRLLGVKIRSVEFKHNRSNPLHLDVLIVDEASMVDLPLMCKLLDALPPQARVVLLGDHNQLSSVETGSVLYDICQSAKAAEHTAQFSQHMSDLISAAAGIDIKYIGRNNNSKEESYSPMQDALVTLRKSHRFSDASEIGQLSKAVINGQIDASLTLLAKGEQTRWHQHATVNDLVQRFAANLHGYFDAIQSGDVTKAFAQLEKQQILCAFKTGEWGVENINHKIEHELVKQGVIELGEADYAGHGIMLSSNDHNLGLFNGDIGIVMPDPENPQLNKAWFKEGPDNIRGVLLSRLPPYDTVYAMTIHKSQGSEFQTIHLCLPDYVAAHHNASLSRELFYTGLTRARESFHLYSKKDVLLNCLTSHCRRSSGLSQRLNQV